MLRIATQGISDDWLSRTIRTVEAVMEQHGFVEDGPVAPQITLSNEESMPTWDKLLRRFNLLRLSRDARLFRSC
jgi:hypothetical protein